MKEAAAAMAVDAGYRSPAPGVGSFRPAKLDPTTTPATAGFPCASPHSVGSSRPEKSESATPISLPSAAGFCSGLSTPVSLLPSAAGFRSGLSCANALFLLSSLKSRQIERQMQEVERLKMLVEDLRGQLIRERLNCKKLKFFSTAETVLLISTMLSFLTFGLLLANF